MPNEENAAPGSLLEMKQVLAAIQDMQTQLSALAQQVQTLIDNSLSLEG